MLQKDDIIAFFDRCAPTWDDGLVHDDAIINTILDNADIGAGCRVLDVACGTGVLIPDYLARGVASVTAIDISPEMARLAAEKFPQKNVTVLCGDVETTQFPAPFDRIVVYNALPHFPDPARLIGILAGLLTEGGRLTVAHGMSRASIDRHHSGSAKRVSCGLMHEDALEALFAPHLDVTVKISDARMYQLVGVKR